MSAVRITLANLRKSFSRRVVAVRDVSLEIESGELFVILGPSGCGKTTLLRMIAGLESPSRGDVLFDGTHVTHDAPASRHIGFVFQQPVLYPHLTVAKNLAFVLRRRRLSRDQLMSRVVGAAEQFRVAHLLERRPHQISVGEQQRVAMARAIIGSLGCMLLDEPFASLDAPLRDELRQELKRIHRASGLTTILVTHDQQEAFALADRVAVMRDGMIVQVGPPLELYRTPSTAFVAKFLGSPGMNLLAGTLVCDRDRMWFTAGTGEHTLRVPIATSARPSSGSAREREATLGIRPEDITLAPRTTTAEAECGAIDGEISAIERLSDRILLGVRCPDGTTLIAKLVFLPSGMDIGQRVSAHFRLDAVHLFERGETDVRMR